jgi:3'-phosphoadenosine 5'-phosphosulfate sulfotransferase (PAPS reductase)/FAD synthetase
MTDYNFSNLHLKNSDVLDLSKEERIYRLNQLIDEAYNIFAVGKQKFIYDDKKELSKVCILFSGGNDSTILFYLFKDIADYAIHINTTIGIPETHDYVVNTCKNFNVELKEYSGSQEDSYDNLVKKFGFPGPGQHYIMYQRLKERALAKAVKEANIPRKQRIVFLSGKRRDESNYRMYAPEFSRSTGHTKSIVWISPIINWTKADINLYRELNPEIPRNFVADMIHMSGECMCGSYARPNEKEEVRMFFPDFIERLERLEDDVKKIETISKEKTNWGWGNKLKQKNRPNKSIGDLCSTCEFSNIENNNTI